MNYNIIDNLTGLNIRNFSEKDILIQAKKNNITKFDMYHILQKDIQNKGIQYRLDSETLIPEAILKGTEKDQNSLYFDKYQDLLLFLDKN